MIYACSDINIFFFKQNTAYEMRISDWSSDVSLPISWPSAENAPKPLPSRSGVAGGPNGHGSEPALSPTSSCPECAISSYCVGCGCSGGTTASGRGPRETGRASCREHVCPYV